MHQLSKSPQLGRAADKILYDSKAKKYDDWHLSTPMSRRLRLSPAFTTAASIIGAELGVLIDNQRFVGYIPTLSVLTIPSVTTATRAPLILVMLAYGELLHTPSPP